MATPHINAEMGAFAEVVLMPGDPLRAQFIAENFLENAKQVCNVRNMFGYTGTYKGKAVSVMGHGMGIPSCSIYATELIKDFGVKKLLRVGSCGALAEDLKLGDVVIGMGASTNSQVNRTRFGGNDFAAIADYEMLHNAHQAAQQCGIPVRVGNIFTDDLFYTPKPEFFKVMQKHGILGVEMETAGLYGVAAEYGVKALAICSVSDHIITGELMSAEARVTSFNNMINVALTSII